MTCFTLDFISFSTSEVQRHKEDIEKWAQRSDNPLLQTLAKEVLQAAQQQKESLQSTNF